MAQLVLVDRQDLRKAEGGDVEQSAVEIEIVEFEQRLVREAAFVIGDDQLAIAMLHAFVVRNRVILKGPDGDGDKRS